MCELCDWATQPRRDDLLLHAAFDQTDRQPDQCVNEVLLHCVAYLGVNIRSSS